MSNSERRTSSLSSLSLRILSAYIIQTGQFFSISSLHGFNVACVFYQLRDQTDEFPSTKGGTYALKAFSNICITGPKALAYQVTTLISIARYFIYMGRKR